MAENMNLNQDSNIKKPDGMSFYNPGSYSILAILFSPVPVFIMSFSNAKKLQNGEKIKGGMKKFVFAFIIILLFNMVAQGANSFIATKRVYSQLSQNPAFAADLLLQRTFNSSYPFEVQSIIRLHQDISRLLTWIFIIIHIIFIIFLIRFVNKTEWPDYKAARENYPIKNKPPFLPIFLGLIFVLSVFFGYPKFVESTNKILLRGLLSAPVQKNSKTKTTGLEKIEYRSIEPTELRTDLFDLQLALEKYHNSVGKYPVVFEGEVNISPLSILTENGWESSNQMQGKNLFFEASKLSRFGGRAEFYYQPTPEGSYYKIQIIVDGRIQYCMARLGIYETVEYFKGSCAGAKK